MMPEIGKYTVTANGCRTLTEAISELNREIAVRRKIMDRWVSEGKLDWLDASDRTERCLSALAFLIQLSYAVERSGGDHHNIRPGNLVNQSLTCDHIKLLDSPAAEAIA